MTYKQRYISNSTSPIRQKGVTAKLLQSVREVYQKVCQALQSTSGNTKCDRWLLESASDIKKCGSYCKVKCNSIDKFPFWGEYCALVYISVLL